MSTPPVLLFATLLFWGWQTGNLYLGLAGAGLLEGSRLLPWRWTFPPAAIRRAVYLCTLLLAGFFIFFVFLGNQSNTASAFISPLQRLPIILFPLLLVQVYAETGRVDLNALFLWRKTGGEDVRAPRPVDLAFPYLSLTLLSAALANNHREVWFYAAFVLLTAWALGSGRPRGGGRVVPALLFLLVAVVGYAGQVQLNRLQGKVEEVVQRVFFESFAGRESDPFRSQTAMGEIGSLQLSDEIVLRVTARSPLTLPFLLRETSYNTLILTTWMSRGSVFRAVPAGPDGQSWDLGSAPWERELRITVQLPDGKGPLPLPRGAARIEGLAAGTMKASAAGVVTVEDGPALADFEVGYGPNGTEVAEYAAAGLKVPKGEATVIATLAKDLGLAGQPVPQALARVKDYFATNFHYATYQEQPDQKVTPLADFLLRSHAGHCEYFATATVLLLRSAGIPARYVGGYSVQEFSLWEKAYLVRGRHAHAWVEVFHDGAWHDFDTTPAAWFETQQQRRSGLRMISDLWSWARFKLDRWKSGLAPSASVTYLGWLVLPPVLAVIGVRLYRARRRQPGVNRDAAVTRLTPGADSAFYALETALAKAGIVRATWEPMTRLLEKVEKRPDLGLSVAQLHRIIALHYRYRFDPAGIDDEECAELKMLAHAVARQVGEMSWQ